MISKEHPVWRVSILKPELRWTKSSGINSARLKENPTVLLSASILEHKRGR